MDQLNSLTKVQYVIDKEKVRLQVRQTHLGKRGERDLETEQLLERLTDMEKYVDGRIAKILEGHPAYPWFSRVKGIGKENIGKVVGLLRIKPEQGLRKIEGTDPPDYEMVDLPYAQTISAVWKFCGYSVENGHAPKKTKGEKLSYNNTLRSMCWRLGSSLMRARGNFYEIYLKNKEMYRQRYQNAGWCIVAKKDDPEHLIISEGHIHNMALRKMIKLFLACLFLTWREAEGLPATKPYAIDQLGHDSYIDPWNLVDR